ncbi:DUF317 domain-containing protein [Streptomyces liangshanensis]|uniref:DUF317 domain-containing protein n=1 Tax=Streptomyces liangshanensis TaxID=2717324 RepID=UPI0036DA51FB
MGSVGRGGAPDGWKCEFSVGRSPSADSAMAEWNAYFTTDVPYEVLTDLLIVLGTRMAPDIGTAGPQTVLNTLSAKGWIRDLDRPQTTVTDAAFTCSVSLELLPPLIQDDDPRPDQLGWQAWAEPVLGAPYLWCATFSPSVPRDLVAAFASSLGVAGPSAPALLAQEQRPQSPQCRKDPHSPALRRSPRHRDSGSCHDRVGPIPHRRGRL